WTSPIRDATGRWITSHVVNQDIVAWVGQGRIADRTKENLGASDRGVSLMRKQLLKDIDAVAAGKDPKGLIRDAARNARVALPNIGRKLYTDGMTLAIPRASVLEKSAGRFPLALRPAGGNSPRVPPGDGSRVRRSSAPRRARPTSFVKFSAERRLPETA